MPLAIMPGSGLPVFFTIAHSIAVIAPNAPATAVLSGDGGELHVGGGERRCGVEAEPAEQQDEGAEHRHRNVVTGDGPRLAVRSELADASTEHLGTGEGGDAARGVYDAGTGEVDVTGTEAHRVPGLAAASRRPMSIAANSG